MAADIKAKFGSSAAFTITLASLATDSDKTAGRESAVIDNSSNLYLDALVGGKITTGTSPTANKSIDIWVYAAIDDTPTYPDVLDGTDSDEDFSTPERRNAAVRLGATAIVTSTSDTAYWFAPFSVAALFGGVLPKRWGLFVTHDTGVNLNSTGGNHALSYTPVYAQTV